MKLFSVAIALTISFSAPAFAGHCPKDVKLISEAVLSAEGLSSAQVSEIERLRKEGEMLHKNGEHTASLTILHEALTMLGIKSH